tara:strand:- start:32966 stop:33124 length:159 start_codon:yes stop_codon:yes gene_type:complete
MVSSPSIALGTVSKLDLQHRWGLKITHRENEKPLIYIADKGVSNIGGAHHFS